jgi:SAM-dependent methyltransferase
MKSSECLCRSCNKTDLVPFLDLGQTPLADRFLNEAQLKLPEPHYPLEVAFCLNCGLAQILKTVPPEELFCEAYPYYSSFSPALLEHSRENVVDLIESRALGSDNFVIELASNDGYLLKNYIEKGIPAMGIDPADGPAKAAEKAGVPTLNTFFTRELALQLRKEGRGADVIHANNVLAHVADTNGFVEGIAILLNAQGVAVIEVPYVRDLIDHCEFDTIYHEHLCYFSVTALDNLFRSHSLYLNEVKRLSIHGGSLRLYVGHEESVCNSVRTLLAEEDALKVNDVDYYRDFSGKVNHVKNSLNSLLSDLKADGKTIAAYGAAAKGSTLINYVDIENDYIDFVVDRNIHKHGLHMPGKHWPIYETEKLVEVMPDYVLVLAWNFADEIFEQQAEYRERGGKFILPVPEPRVI